MESLSSSRVQYSHVQSWNEPELADGLQAISVPPRALSIAHRTLATLPLQQIKLKPAYLSRMSVPVAHAASRGPLMQLTAETETRHDRGH
jgi:hypothetical protein